MWLDVRYCMCVRTKELHSEDAITVTARSVRALNSNQEEADTCIILHYLHTAATMPAS